MAKAIKFNNAVLCEYVAKADGGKHTLVNVFSGDILLAEFPAHLQLGLYVELVVEVDTPHLLEMDVKLDGKIFATAKVGIKLNKKNSSNNRVANIVIPSFEVGIDKELKFEVVARAEGYRATKILTKRIMKGSAQEPSSPNAS